MLKLLKSYIFYTLISCFFVLPVKKHTRYFILYAFSFILQAPYRLPYSVLLSFLMYTQCTLSVSDIDHSYVFYTGCRWVYSRLLRSFVLSLSHLFFFCELPVSSTIRCIFYHTLISPILTGDFLSQHCTFFMFRI